MCVTNKVYYEQINGKVGRNLNEDFSDIRV